MLVSDVVKLCGVVLPVCWRSRSSGHGQLAKGKMGLNDTDTPLAAHYSE